MIRINQLKLPLNHTRENLWEKTAKVLKIPVSDLLSLEILKQSVDARKKQEICFTYSLNAAVKKEKDVLHKVKNKDIFQTEKKEYRFPVSGPPLSAPRPVIVRTGPAGLFCGLLLAKNGYKPILLERGEPVEERRQAVERFWETGVLKPDSNVQFGEGGAGTFSDGKLNTLVKDPFMRNRKVLELFVEFGADPSILYVNKPHLGTDILSGIVRNIREEIRRLGGEVRFHSLVTDLVIKDNRICEIVVNNQESLPAEVCVLAIGHSARDTFELLEQKGVPMEAKAFAAGLRIQHPQEAINHIQYGENSPSLLGAAEYKLTHSCANGRGVYSFCMCPGGYVVNASSEPGRLAVNGMSYQKRDGQNANSALIVTVKPEDFDGPSPLAGIAYQRKLEEAAFLYGNGRIPVQLYGDFKENRLGTGFGAVEPALKGSYFFANLREILPDYLNQSLLEGIKAFESKIRGFSRPDAILAGVESRTSSPVRILREETMQSPVRGLYPCGEGAGYAGGITSAAMDGVKAAEAIASALTKPQK